MIHRTLCIVLVAIALVACGGDDDGDDGESSTGGDGAVATESSAAGQSTATGETTSTGATSSTGGTSSVAGAPTHGSETNPNVELPLEAGSSGEVPSQDPDPSSEAVTNLQLDPTSKVRVTINEIMDPAVIEGSVVAPEPGNRWWAMDVTVEATGTSVANTGIWFLATTDGIERENIIALGTPRDIFYGPLEAGTSEQGVVIFEIPEDATVQWVMMDPTIFVGGKLVFVAS